MPYIGGIVRRQVLILFLCILLHEHVALVQHVRKLFQMVGAHPLLLKNVDEGVPVYLVSVVLAFVFFPQVSRPISLATARHVVGPTQYKCQKEVPLLRVVLIQAVFIITDAAQELVCGVCSGAQPVCFGLASDIVSVWRQS